MSEVILKSPLSEIGRIIRLFREKTDRNLSDVSAAAGISTSMLSQIERGLVSPSIDTLFAVCNAMGLEVSDLFSRVSPRTPVRVAPAGRRLRTENQGILYEQIVASSDRAYPAEMFLLELQPGKEAGVSGRGHEGVEMGYVLAGHATLTVDGVDHAIAEGDGVSFSSHLPHRLVNSGDALFRAVWSVVPPHTDYLGVAQATDEQ
jgi:transcriptional regulator with XRE-family HTH domain